MYKPLHPLLFKLTEITKLTHFETTDPSLTRWHSHLYCSYILHELVRVGCSEEHRTYTLISQAPRCRRVVNMFNIYHQQYHTQALNTFNIH